MPKLLTPSEWKAIEALLDSLNDVAGYEENGKIPVRGDIPAEVIARVCALTRYEWES